MTEIEEAAGVLVNRMEGLPLHRWYSSYYHMLAKAVTQPEKNVVGSPLGDITFYASALVWEVSEVGDAVYQLPEYKKLLELLKDEDLVHDAQTMSAMEYDEYIQQTCSECPAEINEGLVLALTHKTRPN